MSRQADGRLHVIVICGGRSGEHEVSIASARSVVEQLDPNKYTVTLVGITKEGHWILPQDSAHALSEGLEATPAVSALIRVDHDSRALLEVRGSNFQIRERIDVVFPVLHGPFGEDGTVQGLLELAGVPYVGAGVLGSAVGMDKAIMKTLFRAAGLPVPDWVVVHKHQWQRDRNRILTWVAAEIGFPCFVKPANLGSSVGITKAHDPAELPAALDLAAEYDLKVVVEKAVPSAREIECSVLGNHDPQVSVPGEIIPSREFYSYEAKYLDDASQLVIPADLPEQVTAQVQEMALRAFHATDCAGLARVDFLVRADTLEVFVSEINTIPGFTRISMYPKLWEASGVSYPELLDRLIQLALERHAAKMSLRTSYQ